MAQAVADLFPGAKYAIGPAIVSGKSVFIYGPPGNGKTVIAEGRFFGVDDHFRLGLGGDPSEFRRGLRNVQRALRELA